MLSESDEKDLKEWCANAVKMKLTQEDVRKKFMKYPREVRKYVFKTFKKMKGGLINMPLLKKKQKQPEPEEEYPEETEEEEEEEESEEVEEEPTPKHVKKDNPQKVQQNWFIDYQAERFRVIDPVKKLIIIESNSAADLQLQLQLKILQRLYERL